MNEGTQRLGLFLDTLIILIPVLIIGFIAEIVENERPIKLSPLRWNR